MDILILPGDDIGPEISAQTRRVLAAADEIFGLGLEFEEMPVGVTAHRLHGTTVPDKVLETARAADGIILGPAGMTDYPEGETGWLNVPGTIRKRLDLYANIRPARSRAGVPDARPGLDCLIVRENTEGFYSDRNMFQGSGEFMPTSDVGLSVRKITRPACNRLAHAAFRAAARRRKHVTAVGKRHVLKLTDGIFIEEIDRVSRDYPDVEWREVDIDAMAADLYSHPDRFDVIAITNMFGDILSNAAVAMSGSLGLAAALNAGDGKAAANAGHGSAPDIAGKGIANPTGLMLSATLLLEWLGEQGGRNSFAEAAAALNAAMDNALSLPATRTRDVGGTASTVEFADAVIARLRSQGN
jgi:3-isopropylmalate dehydrogenase